MKYQDTIFIGLIFFFTSNISRSQNFIPGIYFFQEPCLVQQLKLTPDNKSIRTFKGTSGTTKYAGKWFVKSDTVFLFDEGTIKRDGTLELLNDTLTFKFRNEFRIDLINKSGITIPYLKQSEFFLDGKTSKEIRWSNYMFPVNVTSYYENGFVDEIYNYKKGRKYGTYSKNNENGVLIIAGFYRRDKPYHKWKYYDGNGLLKKHK